MKKIFSAPAMELILVKSADIIATSSMMYSGSNFGTGVTTAEGRGWFDDDGWD